MSRARSAAPPSATLVIGPFPAPPCPPSSGANRRGPELRTRRCTGYLPVPFSNGVKPQNIRQQLFSSPTCLAAPGMRSTVISTLSSAHCHQHTGIRTLSLGTVRCLTSGSTPLRQSFDNWRSTSAPVPRSPASPAPVSALLAPSIDGMAIVVASGGTRCARPVAGSPNNEIGEETCFASSPRWP